MLTVSPSVRSTESQVLKLNPEYMQERTGDALDSLDSVEDNH